MNNMGGIIFVGVFLCGIGVLIFYKIKWGRETRQDAKKREDKIEGERSREK